MMTWCITACTSLRCVAVCCSVLQRVAACCSVLQRVSACCSTLQCVAACCSVCSVHMDWVQRHGPCNICEVRDQGVLGHLCRNSLKYAQYSIDWKKDCRTDFSEISPLAYTLALSPSSPFFRIPSFSSSCSVCVCVCVRVCVYVFVCDGDDVYVVMRPDWNVSRNYSIWVGKNWQQLAALKVCQGPLVKKPDQTGIWCQRTCQKRARLIGPSDRLFWQKRPLQ